MDSTTAAVETTAVIDNTSTSGNLTEESSPDVCDDTFSFEVFFTFVYILPMVIIVLLMSFFKARKNLWPKFLKGRPGILYPVNFIDEYKRRWMYIAVLLLLTYRILFLFNGTYYLRITLPKDVKFLNVFVTIINVIILCLQYYPLAACVVMRKHIIANILGLLLIIPWFAVFFFRYLVCPPSSDKSQYHAILEIFYEIPLFVALAALIAGYAYDLYRNINAYCRRASSYNMKEEERIPKEQEELCLKYIRALLKKNRSNDRPLTFKEKIKKRFTYVRVRGFRYPPRVVCTVALGLYALYKTAVSLTTEVYMGLDNLAGFAGGLASAFSEENDTNRTVYIVRVYTDSAKWGFTACAIASFIGHICLMLHFVTQYRSHIRKFFSGDHTWHYQFKNSPSSILIAGMRYSGYQIAYLIYGFIIMTLMLFLVVIIVVGFIIIPLATKTRNVIANILIDKIQSLWPAILIGLVAALVQTLLARFAFLQERGAYMALNNRRLYHVASFFLFFFSVVIGIFSCLKRILLSMLFSTLLISRLDRCMMMRGFEQFDAGFKAYLSMLTVDVYHNHPILKGFIYILKEQVQAPKTILTYDKEGNVDTAIELRRRMRIRVRNRYWKMLTLINNPSLMLDRVRQNIEEAKMKNTSGTAQYAVDSIFGLESAILRGVSIPEAEGEQKDTYQRLQMEDKKENCETL